MPGIAVGGQPLTVAGQPHLRCDSGTCLLLAQERQHGLKLIFRIWRKKEDVLPNTELSAPKTAANPRRAD